MAISISMIFQAGLIVLSGMLLFNSSADKAFIDANEARQDSELSFQGEYHGQLSLDDGANKKVAGIIVSVYGEDSIRAVLYFGGLPGDSPEPIAKEGSIQLEGKYEDHTLRLKGDFPLSFQYIHGRITALDEQNNYMGHFHRVDRECSTP